MLHDNVQENPNVTPHTMDLNPHQTDGSLGQPNSHARWHHDLFSSFCRAHGHDQHTEYYRHRQTDRQSML